MNTNNTRIITKSASKVRTEFYSGMGGIGYVETILFGCLILLIIGLPLALPYLYISIPLDFLCFFIFLFLITPNPKGNGKVYNYLINALTFALRKKRYYHEETLHFFPFKAQKQKYLTLNNNQTMIVMEINGFDISLLTDEECNFYVLNLGRWFKNIDCKIQLTKIEKHFNLQEQNNYLCELADYWEKEYQNAKINQTTYENIFEQLSELRDINFNIENDQNFKCSSFYLTVYANNQRELEQIVNHFNLYLTKAKLTVKVLDQTASSTMIANLMLPLNKEKISDQKELINTIKNSTLTFHKNYWEFNNNFYAITTIKDYPNLVGDGWLIKLANLEQTNMVCNFIDLDKTQSLKMLDKAIERVNLNQLDTKKSSAEKENELYLRNFNYLIDALKEENEKLKLTQIYFITYAKDLEKLKEINNHLYGVINECDMTYSNLSFQQEIALFNIFNNTNFKDIKSSSNEMATTTIAAMFPFIDNTLMDSKGLLMGQTSSGVPYYFDIKTKDNNYRDSFNAFIVGKTGSGKTYNVKKQLNWLFLNKTRVFIIDPEREFHGFVNKYQAKVIDCGQAKSGLINPLQIFNNTLQSHIRNLEQWFKLIFPDITDHIISILEEILFEVYNQKNINFSTTEKQLNDLKVNEWPILNDCYLVATKKFENSKNIVEKEITGYLKQLSSIGAYGQLWNGYTTLELSLAKFIILDVYTLRNNKKMINAQLFLMLQFLENEAIKNKNRNELLVEAEQEWVCIAVDEAHLLIDKHNLIALQFLYEMTKRARKYNTSVYIVTQNINDFVGDNDIKKQAEGIMNNCLYQFVHNLADKDLQDYNAILKASGGLNEFELQAISTAKQGDCLFTIGSHNRSFLHIQASDTEASAWMKNKNMIDKPQNKLLNGYINNIDNNYDEVIN